jgi:hypothetical protein
VDVFILLGVFTIVCLMGVPVAYALGLAAIVGALWTGIPLEAVMLKVSGGMSGFSLLAIPFFILCGTIMAVGGMAERLVNLAKVFVGFIRGGMALVNIVASTMFGCISGSSVADTAAVGGVMIPQMIRNGYPRLFAVNVTISGSLQPLLLPPSHNMIIYSLAAGGSISVAHLFMAGVIPALLLGLSLIVLVLIIAHRENFPKGEVVPLRQALKIALDALWGLGTIVIILGGILTKVFTPTESGAVACVYAFLVTMFVYRDCKWRDLPKLIARVVRTVGMVGHDRLLDRLRLHDGDPAGAGEGLGVLRRDLERQAHVPALHQCPPAAARHVHGSGADAADLHADLPADHPAVRHRPGALRHRHDPQSGHRVAHAAGRAHHGGRLRDRRGQHGGRFTLHSGVLRTDADRAHAGHLSAGAVALASRRAAEVDQINAAEARSSPVCMIVCA